jgi:predicted O-methyltransferase YrrM
MDLILPEINNYALQNSSQDDPLLNEIKIYTEQNHAEPHMLSGPLQGAFLSMVSGMIKPKKILEIGTFMGYSALCLAKGLTADGMLHTIEKREEDAKTAQLFFNRSGFKDKIQLHIGNASEILNELQIDWDLIFVDADKTGYLAYYKFLIEKVKPGTWFLFDNVFFHGEVLASTIKGKNAKAISEFNEYIKNDSRVEKVVLTIRDGLTLLYKK